MKKYLITFLFINSLFSQINENKIPNRIGQDFITRQNLNVIDIVLLVGFILGNEIPNDDEFILSDMNGDGSLNVIDVVVLVNTILN